LEDELICLCRGTQGQEKQAQATTVFHRQGQQGRLMSFKQGEGWLNDSIPSILLA
jgi:hypothetical protein